MKKNDDFKKRFKLLLEYDFYAEPINEEEDEDMEPNEDESFEGEETDLESTEEEGSEETEGFDSEETDVETTEEEGGEDMSFGDDTELDGFSEEETEDDEVEVDVTQIVTSIDDNKDLLSRVESNIGDLSSKFKEINATLNTVNTLSDKLNNLEKEIVKRNPTNLEKMENRSLDSYPYNLRLDDIWSRAEEGVIEKKEQPEEYILNNEVIDSEYSEQNLKDSFDPTKDISEI
jgi:hypothetical protein